MCSFKDKKVICLAQTPFQLIGLLALFIGENVAKCKECDLIIVDQFPGAREFAKRLTATQLFSNIECISPIYRTDSHQGHSYIFNTILKPRSNESKFRSISPLFCDKEYDVLICSSATRIALEIKRYLLPCGETYFIDDGVGSHTGEVFKSFGCLDSAPFCRITPKFGVEGVRSLVKRLGILLAGKKGRLNITHIFLFNPTDDDYKRYIPSVIKCIECNDPEKCRKIFSVLGFNEFPEEEIHSLYLSLPDDESPAMLAAEYEIISTLLKYEPGLKIRYHPRSKSSKLRKLNIAEISNKTPWELLIVNGAVSEETRLYGFASSAQVHPKSLFSIEPIVVFLHKLIPDISQEDVFDGIFHKLKSSYKDKAKVLAPSDVFELKECISCISVSSNSNF